MPESLGIFGGTFDPPHLGHLILAAEALQQLQLKRVIWVLTPQPPHKPEGLVSESEQRLEMLKRATALQPGFEISTIESERPGPHYTLDTIDLLQAKYPWTRLVLLLGSDSLRNLPTWYKSDELVTAVHSFGVMRRPGSLPDLKTLETSLPGLTRKVRFFETPQLEISSSIIRQRIEDGGHFRYYLPTSVYEYIQQNNLYR